MKILSWNVNGLRSILNKKYLHELITDIEPDIFCLSEIKCNSNLNTNSIFSNYYSYFNYSIDKKGYSGTAIFSLIEPLNVIYNLNSDINDNTCNESEGRIITCEFEKYYLINVYTPNSGAVLKRLDYRINEWDTNFSKFLNKLQKKKPLIICGDLNVAHKEIDIKNSKQNLRSAGYTIEERDSFDNILKKNKLIDTFRYLNPELIKYSYWTYKFHARLHNIGWRIDYFLLSKKLLKYLKKSDILENILGSDHAPILLELK
jgi:exodeoxyribonuclease-3